VLQDVLTRLDTAFQAFFRHSKHGQTPGYPRFQGSTRYTSFTCKQLGNGVTVDTGFLVPSKSGRLAVRWSRALEPPAGAVRWSRPLEGTPKTVTRSREADGWYAGFSCADIPLQPLPATGHETGIDRGLDACAPTSDGTRILHPGWFHPGW
jgi:putative transposase